MTSHRNEKKKTDDCCENLEHTPSKTRNLNNIIKDSK